MNTFLKNNKILFVIVIFFLLMIYIVVPSVNYTSCLSNQKFQKISIDGVVLKRYLDKSQHSTPIVEIRNSNGRIESVYFFGDHSGLYNRIQIEDTLRKKKGSNEILIKSQGKYLRLGIADFECDSAKLENEKLLFGVYDLIGTVPPDVTKEESQN